MSRDSGDSTHDKLIALFLSYLSDTAHVLDVGCAAGGDSLYFKENGRTVTAIDTFLPLCESASKRLSQEVRCAGVRDVDYVEEFDGIWVSGEFVHIETHEFEDVVSRLAVALKPEGLLYVGLRAGEFVEESEKDVLRFNKQEAREAFRKTGKFDVIECLWRDYTVDGDKDAWLHLFLRRKAWIL